MLTQFNINTQGLKLKLITNMILIALFYNAQQIREHLILFYDSLQKPSSVMDCPLCTKMNAHWMCIDRVHTTRNQAEFNPVWNHKPAHTSRDNYKLYHKNNN